MGLFSGLAGIFTGGGGERLLMQGIEHAKAKRPEKAIEIYNSLLASSSTNEEVRGKALFNRSLAYSSMNEEAKALADLQEVLEMPKLPANIHNAARGCITRLKHRKE